MQYFKSVRYLLRKIKIISFSKLFFFDITNLYVKKYEIGFADLIENTS